MNERTPWDDARELAATIGHEAFFDPRLVRHPPLVCKPSPVDWEFCPKEQG